MCDVRPGEDLTYFRVRFFATEAQNDRGNRVVILNAVKDLAFFTLRFFAKEAQNDRAVGLSSCNAVKDLALFTLKILRNRGSE